MTRYICRGATRIRWLPEGFAETREALDRCSTELDIEIAELNGFREAADTHEMIFYDAPKIRELLQEGAEGKIAIYSVHTKDLIEWFPVRVKSVESEQHSESSYPRFSVIFASV